MAGPNAGPRPLQADVLDENGFRRGRSTAREIHLPYAKNARESVSYAHITSETPEEWGIEGNPRNLDWKEESPIAKAERLDRDGYETSGLNIHTGRSRSTKFTGRK